MRRSSRTSKALRDPHHLDGPDHRVRYDLLLYVLVERADGPAWVRVFSSPADKVSRSRAMQILRFLAARLSAERLAHDQSHCSTGVA
jgi:hypothetical protein